MIELPDAGFAERAQVPLGQVETPLRDRLPIEPAAGFLHAWSPFVEVPIRLNVEVLRERRDRCVNCRQRRVLYRIYVGSGPHADKTEARCALCWGIR